MKPTKYSNSQRNIVNKKQHWKKCHHWEKGETKAKKWSEAMTRSGLWQHRSLFPAPPILPRSECVGALLNQIHSAAPITNDSASVGLC